MDIEGGELHALQGAINLLSTRQPLIYLATHGKGLYQACTNFLIDSGYAIEKLVVSTTKSLLDQNDS